MNENLMYLYVFIYIYMCREREIERVVDRQNVSFICMFIYGYY